MENKKPGSNILTKKVTSIVGAVLASLTGINAVAYVSTSEADNNEDNYNKIQNFKTKPQSVLKLNMNNPEMSKFVSSHGSHSSHASHASHASHSSHYSGR